MMRRIALSQRVDLVPGRDERRDCLDQAWAELLAAQGWLPLPLPNRLADPAGVLRELAVDGLILTGGNDLATVTGATGAAPERDRTEAALLVACTRAAIPVLGVCRGMQMMVAHLGGRIVPVSGHVAAPHGLRARPEGLLPLGDREQVNSFHGFGVQEPGLPADLVAVGWAPDGSVEALVHRRHRQWGIMWHPERAPRDPRDVELLRALFARGA